MTPQAATETRVVAVTLPIPPRTLGKGSSHHWRDVRRDAETCQLVAYHLLCTEMQRAGIVVGEDAPWDGARMDIDWYCAGTPPDDDNAITRCAAYRDAVEAVGLVANDRDIHVGTVTFTKARRRDACIVLTFIQCAVRPASGRDAGVE